MKRIRIYYKITFIFGIIIGGILLGIYAYLNNSLRENAYERIRTNLKKQTLLVKTFLEEDIPKSYEKEDLDQIADHSGKNLELRVTIIGLDGIVLGDSELDGKDLFEMENHLHRPEVQEVLKSGEGESRRFSTTLKKDMLYVAYPFGNPEVQGVVRLAIPLSEIKLISDNLKKFLGGAFLAAFILAVIFGYFASIFISRPIEEISNTAKAIAGGDFSKRILVSRNDEIGDLAQSFNHMSKQIKMRIDEVSSNKSRLEAILLNMFEGVMVVDISKNILLINQTLKDFLGIKNDPLNKKPIEVIRNVDICEVINRTLKIKKGVESKEISIFIPEEKVLLVNATPVVHNDKVEGAVLVFHDISELRRLGKIRQDFIANVSHELRTPVTSIKGCTETLINGALEDKDNAEDFLKIIHSDADQLARLINDLLDLSKIESGELKIQTKSIEIRPVIDRVISGFKIQVKEKLITVNINIPENIPKILADETRIIQVLLNLVDNSVKYSPKNGQINISAEEKDGFVQINVSDNGPGIPGEDISRVFERFYRIDKARSRELGGTGLGLSIVKHIVQIHNGEVSVKSELGKGSTFSFTIPKI